MNLRQLRHLLAVVEHGSLGRASEKLHLSQPALSKSIQKLEEQLGVALLHRGATGMTPTEYGSALIQHVRLINAQVDHAIREIEGLKGLSHGSAVVGAGPAIALAMMPRVLSRLLARYPGVSVSVIEGLGTTLTAALLDGTADFILAPGIEGLPHSELVLEPLYADASGIICRAGHPMTKRRAPTLAELAALPWVLPRRPDRFRDHLERMFQEAGLGSPVPAVETNSLALMKAVLLGTDAVSFLPLSVVSDERRLVALPDAQRVAEHQIFVIRRRLSVLSPVAKALLDELRQVASSLEA